MNNLNDNFEASRVYRGNRHIIKDQIIQGDDYEVDGVRRSFWSNPDKSHSCHLFKMVKENFYQKDDEDEWYSNCGYTDEELNQMQLISPSWTVGLLNLSYQSEDTSETTTSFKIYDELSGFDFESIDIISTFSGQVKVKNNFDLRNFPSRNDEIDS